MRLHAISLLAVIGLFSVPAFAQKIGAPSNGRVELGANYNWLHANAPTGQCGCFSANGGSGVVAVNLPHSFSVIADISGATASNVSGTTQNVTLFNYLFGGRYSIHTGSRLTIYGQALAGVSHESSNYVFVQARSAFAFSLGGGAKLLIGRRFGLNLIQADWIHSDLPNGTNDRQNDVRLGGGIYVSFGSKLK